MTFEAATGFQAAFCEQSSAPITSACCRARAAALNEAIETGRRVRSWQGDLIADALPLRLVAPFMLSTGAGFSLTWVMSR